jgi:hypothetical protein
MIVASRPTLESMRSAVATDGFVFVRGHALRELLTATSLLPDAEAFAASWNDLPLDTYMADGGRYRRRRHANFAADSHAIVRGPHAPHYQSLEYNPVNGGIARWFEPVRDEIAAGGTMSAILQFCRRFFGELAPHDVRWHVEVHQFRIEARRGEQALPTPEGVHRDGVDYVMVMLVGRRNIAQGVTTIHAVDGAPLGSFTLAEPFDAALLDDHRVAHGVTAVEALDPNGPAYRDVLVVTFQAVRSA